MIRVLFVSLALTACADPPPPAPRSATVTLEIQGMHCNGCAMAITEAVEKVGGVSRCRVSLEDESAQVELDPARVTAAAVVAVIDGLGYQAGLPGEAPAGEPAGEPTPAGEPEGSEPSSAQAPAAQAPAAQAPDAAADEPAPKAAADEPAPAP